MTSIKHELTKADMKIAIHNLVQSLKITSDTTYIFNGKSYSVGSARSLSNLKEEKKNPIISHITQLFYQIYHCKHLPDAADNTDTKENDIRRNFVGSLSEANSSRGTWESEWELKKVGKNQAEWLVYKDGVNFWINKEQFISYDNIIREGKKGYVWTVKEWRKLMPGFYVAFGESYQDRQATLIRLYFNLQSSGAVQYIQSVTTELNKEEIPFQTKIINNPNDFLRTDSAVLYLNKENLVKCRGPLSRIYKKIKYHLNSPTSIFAKRLTDGVSLAEDPGNGESFGEHRARILAEAAYNTRNISSPNDRITKIIKYCTRSGVEIVLRPYLNRGSLDKYDHIMKGVFS